VSEGSALDPSLTGSAGVDEDASVASPFFLRAFLVCGGMHERDHNRQCSLINAVYLPALSTLS